MGPWLIDVGSRDEFDTWTGDDPPTPYRPVVMVVRDDSEVIREFLPNALDAAKLQEERVVLWVKDADMLTRDEKEQWFLSDDSIVAVVLSENHRVMGWVSADRIGVDDAEFAFRQAGR